MLHGITTREGTVLDRGTGVAKQALLRALRSLQEKNIIRSVRQRSEGRGNEPTIYSLVMASETLGMKVIPPLVSKSDQGAVPESDHGVGAEITPGPRTDFQPTQETGVQETEEQNTVRQQQQDAGDALTEFGIDKSTSNFLIKNHSEAYILEKIGHVRWMQAANQNSLKNPPGFLRRAIEDDWPAPPGYTTTQEAEIVDDCSICDGTGWMPMDSIQVHCDHTGEPSPLADLPPESG